MGKKKITDKKVDEIVEKKSQTDQEIEILADWVLQEFEELDKKSK